MECPSWCQYDVEQDEGGVVEHRRLLASAPGLRVQLEWWDDRLFLSPHWQPASPLLVFYGAEERPLEVPLTREVLAALELTVAESGRSIAS